MNVFVVLKDGGGTWLSGGGLDLFTVLKWDLKFWGGKGGLNLVRVWGFVRVSGEWWNPEWKCCG